MIRINLTIDNDINDWLVKEAKKNNITKSDGIRGILKGWIYGNHHKGFVKVDVRKCGVDKRKYWKGSVMSKANIILKKAKEYYIFETFFNGNLKDMDSEHQKKAVEALIGILKDDKEKLREITGNMFHLVEIDELISAVEARDLLRLRKLIHPNDIRMNRYMKGNFDDLNHEEMVKLRRFMAELREESEDSKIRVTKKRS